MGSVKSNRNAYDPDMDFYTMIKQNGKRDFGEQSGFSRKRRDYGRAVLFRQILRLKI